MRSAGEARTLQTDLAITGWGLACAAGDQGFALFGAVGAGLCFARPDAIHEAPARSGTGTAPVLACRAMDAADVPAQRMIDLCAQALASLLDDLGREGVANAEIVLYGPPADSERAELAELASWPTMLRDAFALPEDLALRVEPAPESLSDAFFEAADALQGNRCDRIVLGAVDSLLDPITVARWGEARRVMTRGVADGVVPGEAAAFLVLERASDAGARSRGRLLAIAGRPEPDHGQVEETCLNGLAQAMREAASLAGESPERIECLCVPLAGCRERQLEWHQAMTELWPLQLPEEERLAMQRGEIEAPQPPAQPEREILDPGIALGDTGAATLFLSALLACERFRFERPACKAVLVADVPDAAWRGALWLEAPSEEREAPATPNGRAPTIRQGIRSGSGVGGVEKA